MRGILLCALALLAVPVLAPRAQARAEARSQARAPLLPQWEGRLDVTRADVPAAHVGVGMNVRAGIYARLGVALLAGAARTPADAFNEATTSVSQRVDLNVRFLLDPFAERRVGLYGGAGFSARHDGDEAWKGSLMLVLGVEGAAPRGRRVVPAFELALGGGVRAALVLRSRRQGRAR